ncbi:hypothetical protein MGAS10270_Spy0866 [Streptococcus pyogenes MGAS10270]|nr:hypothetical protein MGAS10270_Spy0866 [Streptococcus pyogenes MGAS10270]
MQYLPFITLLYTKIIQSRKSTVFLGEQFPGLPVVKIKEGRQFLPNLPTFH